MFPSNYFSPRMFAPRYFQRGGGVPAYQQIDVDVVQFLEIPPGRNGCWLQAQVHDVRWRADGTAPTTSVGMILHAGDAPTWFSENLSALQFLGASAGALLSVQFK